MSDPFQEAMDRALKAQGLTKDEWLNMTILEPADTKRMRLEAIKLFKSQWKQLQLEEAACRWCQEARNLNETDKRIRPVCGLHQEARKELLD